MGIIKGERFPQKEEKKLHREEDMSLPEGIAQEAEKFYLEQQAEGSDVSSQETSSGRQKRRGSVSGREDRVPEGGRGSRTGEAPRQPQEESRSSREREAGENEIARLREQLLRAEDAYARAYAAAKSRMGLIRRVLGVENVENDPEVAQAREAYVASREAFDNLSIRGLQDRLRSGQINEVQFRQEAQNLLVDIFVNHDLNLQNKKLQFRQAEDLRRGTLAGRVEAWWNRVVDNYRRLPFWTKIGTSLALFALGGGAVAVSGMIAMRIMGGASSAKGTQELLQSFADRWRQRTSGLRSAERIMGLDQTNLEYRTEALQDLINNYHRDMNQRFARRERGDLLRRHVGIFTGFLVGSGVVSSYLRETIGDWWLGRGGGAAPEAPPVKAHGGGPPMVEGGAKGTVTVPEGTGRGTLSVDERYGAGKYGPEGYGTEAEGHIPEEFRGVSKVIDSGGNIWKATRDAYIENPEKYGYDSNSPKLKNLFNSLKEQGYLRRLGIKANSFGDLSDSEKIKIWAENKTANSVQKLAEAQGGRVRDLVHPGDTIFLKPDGTIVFENTSGIKAGYLSDVQRPRGFGGGYEPQGKGGGSSVDTSEFDRRIEEARARGKAADARLAQIRGPIAAELAAEDARLRNVDIFRTQKLMNYIQGKIYGEGTGVDWKGPAKEFRKRMLEKFIVSDQPMGPSPDFFEKRQYWQAAQEVVKKLGPPVGNESTQDWLARAVTEKKVSPEDIIQTLNRVVNE